MNKNPYNLLPPKVEAEMESSLTQQEMDAVLQLIQLSGGGGGGDSAADFRVFWVDFPAEKEGKVMEESREESVGETTSSSGVINPEKFLEEALPRRRKRVLALADIYRKTAPLIENRTLKRSKI